MAGRNRTLEREDAVIKAITCIKRKQGMEVDAFQSYWLRKHAEVVIKLPNISRYVQSHALIGGYRKGELPYDGIAEIWVESVDVFRAWAGSREYKALEQDEENLRHTLEHIDEVGNEIEKIRRAYYSGDVEAMVAMRIECDQDVEGYGNALVRLGASLKEAAAM